MFRLKLTTSPRNAKHEISMKLINRSLFPLPLAKKLLFSKRIFWYTKKKHRSENRNKNSRKNPRIKCNVKVPKLKANKQKKDEYIKLFERERKKTKQNKKTIQTLFCNWFAIYYTNCERGNWAREVREKEKRKARS